MNILILFSQPWRVGGAETHVESLLKGFAGNKIFLAVNQGSHEEKLNSLRQRYPHVQVVVIQARGVNFWRWRCDLRRLARLIVTERIDVIAAQQRTAGIWAYLLWRKTGIPYTVTMHDPWHRAKFKTLYPKIFPVIFAVSANLAMALIEKFGFEQAQVRLINNGIDFQSFCPGSAAAARGRLNLLPEANIILHVSRLSNVKGAVSLKIIESMAEIVRENPRAQLWIIGEGPLRGRIAQAIAEFNRLHGEKIFLHDFVDTIMDWYHACDLLIGEGRVAMEALACHKPVVAIRNADQFIGAVLPDNIAYACDVNFDGTDLRVTPEALAAAVKSAAWLDDADLKRIADYIKLRLSDEKMAECYRQVFAEIQRDFR